MLYFFEPWDFRTVYWINYVPCCSRHNFINLQWIFFKAVRYLVMIKSGGVLPFTVFLLNEELGLLWFLWNIDFYFFSWGFPVLAFSFQICFLNYIQSKCPSKYNTSVADLQLLWRPFHMWSRRALAISTGSQVYSDSCGVVTYSETVMMMTMTMTAAAIGKMDHWKSR